MANRISILIITYNRPDDLLELLKNLNEQESIDALTEEILVLNNASTEPYTNVTEYIKSHQQKINYILSEENLGVARGRNRLMQMAKGDLMLILDDDTVLTNAQDLQKFASLFDKPFFAQANTGVITPRVIYYDNNQVQLTAFPHKHYQEYADKQHFLTYYFTGCAHIMKRDVLLKTGAYPEDFHYGMEEYDLSYRILNAGYTIGYDNSITVAHKESPLGRAPNYRKLHMQWVNKSKVAWRYLPSIYFITTACSWAIQYLRHSKWHLGLFFVSIVQILQIPFTEKRNRVSKSTLQYLQTVEARLKY